MGEEPLQQTALVHDLDAARVQAERADYPVGSTSLSNTSTSTPCSRNSLASIIPVGPAPTMITSNKTCSVHSGCVSVSRVPRPRSRVTLGANLLPQDVGMAAVLREFAEHVQVDPTKWQ